MIYLVTTELCSRGYSPAYPVFLRLTWLTSSHDHCSTSCDAQSSTWDHGNLEAGGSESRSEHETNLGHKINHNFIIRLNEPRSHLVPYAPSAVLVQHQVTPLLGPLQTHAAPHHGPGQPGRLLGSGDYDVLWHVMMMCDLDIEAVYTRGHEPGPQLSITDISSHQLRDKHADIILTGVKGRKQFNSIVENYMTWIRCHKKSWIV